MPKRPLSACDACGGVDDHPKHRLWDPKPENDFSPPAELVSSTDLEGLEQAHQDQFLSSDIRVRHLDCCAAAGCNVCAASEEVTGGVRGQELIDAITKDKVLKDFVSPNDVTDG